MWQRGDLRSKNWRRRPSVCPSYPSNLNASGERGGEVASRANPELLEDLLEVVFDRMRTNKESGSYFSAREPVCRETGDLELAYGEFSCRLNVPSPSLLARQLKLHTSPCCKYFGAH